MVQKNTLVVVKTTYAALTTAPLGLVSRVQNKCENLLYKLRIRMHIYILLDCPTGPDSGWFLKLH